MLQDLVIPVTCQTANYTAPPQEEKNHVPEGVNLLSRTLTAHTCHRNLTPPPSPDTAGSRHREGFATLSAHTHPRPKQRHPRRVMFSRVIHSGRTCLLQPERFVLARGHTGHGTDKRKMYEKAYLATIFNATAHPRSGPRVSFQSSKLTGSTEQQPPPRISGTRDFCGRVACPCNPR